MDDAADHTAIFRPFDAPDIRRQVRLNPLPLLIAHQNRFLRISRSPSILNQDRILSAQELMSSDPSRPPGRSDDFSLAKYRGRLPMW